MKLQLCGVRGSTPAPGGEFARYGGHTSCVAVSREGGPPRLLLDAGTGIRNVSGLLGGAAFKGSVLLGHLHWDHTQGLPFFTAGDRADARVTVYVPAQANLGAEELLRRAMSPPSFPIPPDQLRGHWSFRELDEGRYDIEGWDVLVREIPHKGGRTFGYRISDGASTVAYLSDHHPYTLGAGPDGEGMYHDNAMTLARDADVLLHDAQYTSAEFAGRRDFGHSTIRYAIGLGAAAGVRKVVLFHHDPSRTDEQLDSVNDGLVGSTVPAIVGTEGLVISAARDERDRGPRASAGTPCADVDMQLRRDAAGGS